MQALPTQPSPSDLITKSLLAVLIKETNHVSFGFLCQFCIRVVWVQCCMKRGRRWTFRIAANKGIKDERESSHSWNWICLFLRCKDLSLGMEGLWEKRQIERSTNARCVGSTMAMEAGQSMEPKGYNSLFQYYVQQGLLFSVPLWILQRLYRK